jgi:flavin reductase (DIM6/NTAB) family NADH-FMN oxidoreductase RutF/rubredoxin
MDPKALYSLSYGLYIIGSKKGEKLNGQVANTVIQVTSEPPDIAVTINKGNLTHEFIKESRVFTASVLAKDTPLAFIGHFGFKSGRETDKFKGINHILGETGAPIVTDHALAFLEAKVNKELDVGTHTIFVGELVGGKILREGEPMTYAYYHLVKRGTTPKTAPSYHKEEKKEVTTKMAKYKCSVCDYVYDPELGDPESGVAPGTPFEELPDNWVCPVCGAEKDQFEKVEE